MAKRSRSARGEIIDFDLINIKAQLAEAPATIDVAARRTYIDAKDGIKTDQEDGEPFDESVLGTTNELDQEGDPFDLVNG